MAIFKRKKDTAQQIQYIIKEYYGNDISLFASHYAENIYSIPEVRTAIETVASIFSTIPIYHKVVYPDGKAKYLDDDISFVLGMKPNPLQNKTQFMKSSVRQLLLDNNVFIEPNFNYKDGKLQAIYPLPLKYFEFQLNNGRATVKFYDKPKGNILETHDMENLIYLNRFSELSRGSENKLGLYETVVQALSNQILQITNPKKVKALLQGKAGATGNLKEKDARGVMTKFKANLDENVDGVAYIDQQWQIHNVNWQENDVNRDLMSFVINIVYNYFSINEAIINKKATELEREMFIADSIKPMALQMEEEFTYKLFTNEEIKAGHRIEFDVFALSVSTLQAKNALFQTATRNGILNPDECREMIGQPAIPNGYGKRYAVSADCVNIEVADKYQIGKVANKVSTDVLSEDINKTDKEENAENADTK